MVYYAHKPQELIEEDKNFDPTERFTQKDIILITYGDLMQGKESSPLTTLARFCDNVSKGQLMPYIYCPSFLLLLIEGFP